MRRIVVSLILSSFAIGCGRPAPVATPTASSSTPTPAAAAPESPLPVVPPVELGPESRYEAALGEAMAQLARGQIGEALSALEKAKSIQDTELVRGEIDRLRQQLDGQRIATKAAEDIQIVLSQGRADEAARLATLALSQFGGGPVADRFTALKRQADALLLAGPNADDRAAQLRKEAEQAAAARNLRAALVSYDQSLAARPDPTVQQQADQLRQTIGRYDDLRQRAFALRGDPYQLEAAMDLYRQAGAVWDTAENRADWDACTLALQNRRDRVAIADFEVRGDIGIPHPGRVVAEELIPRFRGRFDVIERQQIDKAINELRLESGDAWAADATRRDLARATNVRYLVLGSITPTFGGITVNARMIEAVSGLVVQTAKIVIPNPAELNRQLPNLALMLQMSDAELRQHELSLQQQPPLTVIQPAPLPPLPAVGGPAPVAIVPVTLRPPALGDCVVDDFGRLPPVQAPGGAGVGIVIERDHRLRPRVTQLAIELGDNLFRRGLLSDAFTQYQLALSLNPGQADIQARIDRCRPPIPQPARRRLIVLDFVSAADNAIPPGLGSWTARLLAPYYMPPYEVVDRGQVAWYMGRLGLTLRDVIVDPMARAYLAQALDARYMIVGTLRPTRFGIEATAHMLDAALGYRVDVATVTARNPAELKLRLPELARWMLTDAFVRDARLREADAYNALIAQAEGHFARQQFPQAIGIYHQCLKTRPDDIQVQSLLARAERQARVSELSAQRNQDAGRWNQLVAQQRTQQTQLLADAEAARRQAERAAAAVAEADRRRQQQAAFDRLVGQARAARDKQQWKQSMELFTAALAINKAADVAREQEVVKTRLADFEKLRAAEETAARETAMRKQREEEMARLREQAERDRKRRDEEERARKQREDERDRREYARLMDNARKLADNKRFDEAIDLGNQARRIRPGSEVDQAIAEWTTQRKQLTESAQKKAADKARAEAEAKAKVEAAAAAAAAAAAMQKKAAETPKSPPPLPKEQPKATTPPPLPKEQPKVDQPKTPTPPPLPKEQPKATTPPPLPKEQPKVDQPKTPTPPPLPKEQPKATTPPPLPKEQPKAKTPPPMPKTEPKAEQPKAKTPPPLPKPKSEEKKGPPAEYTRKMTEGATAERQGKYGDAAAAYRDALKLVPNDPAAAKRAEFASHMEVGGKALLARKFSEAVAAYEAALRVAPGDQAATRQLQRARQGK